MERKSWKAGQAMQGYSTQQPSEWAGSGDKLAWVRQQHLLVHTKTRTRCGPHPCGLGCNTCQERKKINIWSTYLSACLYPLHPNQDAHEHTSLSTL